MVALCCDNVTIEIPLSRSRRSQREVRVAAGAWLGQETLGRDRKLLCRDRISRGCVAAGYSMSRSSVAKTKGPCVMTQRFVS